MVVFDTLDNDKIINRLLAGNGLYNIERKKIGYKGYVLFVILRIIIILKIIVFNNGIKRT